MVTTSYMALVLPDVSVTIGPDWAAVLNDAFIRADAHTHEDGYGVRVTQNGLAITGDLSFGTAAVTDAKLVAFTGQASDPATSYKPFVYSKLVGSVYELHYMDNNGNVARLTNAGSVYGGSVTANSFPTASVSLDTTIGSGSAYSHYAVDCSVANRTITLPRAQDVGDGRFFYISDSTGSCTAARTINVVITPLSGNTFNGGATSAAINRPYGTMLFVRTSASTWQIFHDHGLATTTTFGGLKLANDLGGTAYLPTVLELTGTGTSGYTLIKAPTLTFNDTLVTPAINQETTAGPAGTTLTIQAQSAANVGGDLVLASGAGSGAATHGSIYLRSSATDVLSVMGSAQPYVRIDGTGGLRFSGNLTNPVFYINPRGSAGSGTSMLIGAQAAHTAGDGGSVRIFGANAAGAGADSGGNVEITGGDGAGAGFGGSVILNTGAGAAYGTGINLQVKGTTLFQAAEVSSTSYLVLSLNGEVDDIKMPAGTGSKVAYINDALGVPTVDPVDGCIMYSDGGLFSIRNENGSVINFRGDLDVSSPTTGGAGAIGGDPVQYMRITINGTIYKIPLYGNTA